jgi:hypothetical protein
VTEAPPRGGWAAWALEGDLPRLAKVVALVAWAAITALVTANHEPWRDEADQWLFARDFDGGPAELRAYASGLGMPLLLHALLVPLARAGLPYGAMQALHWALGLAVVWLIVWRSPLPPLLRLLLPFSFLFGYEYVVVARSYVLTILLLLLAAALHARRRERPLAMGLLVGLLANTNAHGLLLAFALGLGLLLDLRDVPRQQARRAVGGAALAVALGLLALWQLWPRPDPQELPPAEPSLRGLVWVVADGLVPAIRGAPDPVAAGGAPAEALLALVSLGVVTLTAWRVGAPATRASFVVGVGGLLWIFLFKYAGAARNHGLLQGLLAWAVWVARTATPAPAPQERRALGAVTVGWALACVASFPAAVDSWWRDLREPFSGSLEAARFLRANDLDLGTIAAHQPLECAAALPYLRARTLWYPAFERAGSYMPWGAPFSAAQRLPAVEAAERTRRALPAGTVLVLSDRLPDAERLGFTLIFRSSRAPFRYDEIYYIYRLDRPAR